MKNLNVNEMRSVMGGGYYCKYCNITYGSWWQRQACRFTPLHIAGLMLGDKKTW